MSVKHSREQRLIHWLIKRVKKLSHIEIRLAHDENFWLKIKESANRQHSDSLNQVADLCTILRQQQEQIKKLRRRVEHLERG